ncbi:helix-turn-helix domain-containing protein [Pilimelia anulata]|uniref:helix-turn-helix domain-containing protein n=1 Tax=Pilimelia anulata TaxID=53371 RepID=UPI001664A1E1|nr:helix-turn-helix transcriptional regulator [Pilimelia anulata]
MVRNGPFPVALRAAIAHRGLTLKHLQRRLAGAGIHVGIATLSCWQSGRRHPVRPASLAAVAAIERLLDLPADSLLALLRQADRAPAAPGSRRYADILADPRSLAGLLADLGPYGHQLQVVTSHTTVRIGPDRTLRELDVFQAVAALGPVDRDIAVYTGEARDDPAAVRFAGLEECRVGRVRRDAAAARSVAELLFDRRLATGETHLFRYRVTDANPSVCTEHFRWLPHPPVAMSLRVAFDPAARPARIWRFTRSREGGPYRTREELPGPYDSAHIISVPDKPGCIGLSWEW